MGETVRRLHLRDRRKVTRAGRPVLIESIRIDDADLVRDGAAGLGGARAVASLTLIFAATAADRLHAIRAVLPAEGPVRAAASAWDERLTVRFLSADAFAPPPRGGAGGLDADEPSPCRASGQI